MIILMSRDRMLMIIAGSILLAFLAMPRALCQEKASRQPDNYNSRGMEYFVKGFYYHAPKNELAEARKNYRLAIKEFKAAISRDPSYTDGHRNLARVYCVQKDFDGAVEEYKAVIQLDSGDLDAYVKLALALIKLNRLDEAIQTLNNAKNHISDPKTQNMLDNYITKVWANQSIGVR